MSGKDIRIQSRDGGTFDCYLAAPTGAGKVPAVVLASAIHGVDADIRAIADEFAAQGYLAAAPDLFWRTGAPGPLARDDPRTKARGQPRLERIRAGEADMMDTLAEVRRQPQSNGRAAAMGFCYGGPFAILGPGRLGYDAGIGCHSSQMGDYLGELEPAVKPVCLLWGDRDDWAPPELLEKYRALAARNRNLELHVFPGILHGYMMPGSPTAYDAKTRAFSMGRALAILQGLR
ncbi:MAG: dienelactone hydrolase family protein [Betaproteobacteria bacterium]